MSEWVKIRRSDIEAIERAMPSWDVARIRRGISEAINKAEPLPDAPDVEALREAIRTAMERCRNIVERAKEIVRDLQVDEIVKNIPTREVADLLEATIREREG